MPRPASGAMVLLLLLLPLLYGSSRGETAMRRILSAHEAGTIGRTEAVILLVGSVTSRDDLPAEWTVGTDPARCGTPALHHAAHLAGEDGPPLVNRPELSGPEQTMDSPDGWFKIHWTDTGRDSTTFDYAYGIATAADSSWSVQCCELGFFHPPPDQGAGGDDLYDIYLLWLEGGVLGYSSWSGEYRPPDSTHDCAASHIAVHTGIPDPVKRDCVVAHEFQHAVQFAYDTAEPVWFMENCAVWITELVYPDADDYMSLIVSGENPLRTPWVDIRSCPYSGFPWPWMMWDRWGSQSVRSVWEYCAATGGANMLEAMESMFSDHGSSFEDFFMDYGAWRWFSADNWFEGCGMYGEEVSTWYPGPRVLPYDDVSVLPYSWSQPAYLQPETFGIHWVRVDLSAIQDQWITFDFDGRDGIDWNLGLVMQDLSGRLYYDWSPCDPETGTCQMTVGAEGWDYAVFFPACMDDTSLDHLYEYSIASETGIAEPPVDPLRISLSLSSNPMDRGGFVTLEVPAAGRVVLRAFDIGGRLAATLLDDDLSAGSYPVPVGAACLGTGTYFLVAEAGNVTVVKKIILAR